MNELWALQKKRCFVIIIEIYGKTYVTENIYAIEKFMQSKERAQAIFYLKHKAYPNLCQAQGILLCKVQGTLFLLSESIPHEMHAKITQPGAVSPIIGIFFSGYLY